MLLMWAAAATRNAAEMVRLLIAKGAAVNARAKFNDWPSQITSEPRGQYHAHGGLTPLLYAARGGCYACVDSLVAAGADVNLPTPEGVSPIMIAIENGHNGIARLLMERGGNPHVWDAVRADRAVPCRWRGGGAGGRGAARLRADVVPHRLRADVVLGRAPVPAGEQWPDVVLAPPTTGRRFRTSRWSICCWVLVWTPTRSSTCGGPARRAGVSTIRSSAPGRRRCCAR